MNPFEYLDSLAPPEDPSLSAEPLCVAWDREREKTIPAANATYCKIYHRLQRCIADQIDSTTMSITELGGESQLERDQKSLSISVRAGSDLHMALLRLLRKDKLHLMEIRFLAAIDTKKFDELLEDKTMTKSSMWSFFDPTLSADDVWKYIECHLAFSRIAIDTPVQLVAGSTFVASGPIVANPELARGDWIGGLTSLGVRAVGLVEVANDILTSSTTTITHGSSSNSPTTTST